MASTYSALGHIELPAPGEQRDLWGTIINRSLTLIEDMIAGITEISTNGSSTYIVSEVMGNTDTSRNGILLCNGALIQDLTVQVPNVSHIYHVRNQTTGPFVVKVKTPSGTAVTIPQNCAAIIHVDDAANSDSILFLSAIVSMTTGDPVGDSTLPDGDYGDITITGGGAALTIDPGVVSNAKLATMAASSLKGNATGGVAAPTDLTVAQVKTLLAYTAADVGAQPLDADLTIWAGITPSANAQSLVGAADYAAMRALLDLEPGTDFLSPAAIAAAYQPLSANLTTWAGVASSANGRSLVSAADYAAMRALLDLEVGTDFLSPAAVTAAISAYAQPLDADLTTWAGISPSANAQSLVGAASYAAMRALLDLEAGTDFLSPAAIAAAYQPLDSDLTSIAALTTTAYGRALLEVANAAALTALSNAFVGDSGAGGTKGMVPAPAAGDAAANKYLKANGSWVALPGGGDLLSTNNLSDLTNAATARTNLGLAIGVNVQAYDADLTTWAGLPPSANAQSLVTAADYSAMRTLLGLVIGTNVQAYDADLTTWAGITPAANVGTFLATPSSANLYTALTTKTGSTSSVVFSAGPTITDAVLSQTLAITSDLTPSQITSDQNNYSPASLSTSAILRLDTDSNSGQGRKITGLAGGSDGRVLVAANIGANPLQLMDESASSTAANRFAFEGDLIIQPDESVILFYDSTTSRWRLVRANKRPTKQVFTTPGANTWTKPAGLRGIKVTVVGGGGGGGGPDALAANCGAGCGGAGGGTAIKWIAASSLGATETATVGALGGGGTSSAAGGANGSTGGTSSFGAHCSATGGAGGSRMSTANNTLAVVAGSTGGIGSSGDVNLGGEAGGGAIRLTGAVGIGGSGGSSTHGGGAEGATQGGGGSTGRIYGGGGGGGVTNSATPRNGGNGAQGIIIVEEYY